MQPRATGVVCGRKTWADTDLRFEWRRRQLSVVSDDAHAVVNSSTKRPQKASQRKCASSIAATKMTIVKKR